MTTPDIAAVARGLTKAQRHTLRTLNGPKAVFELSEMGLLVGNPGEWAAITSLGLAVRAYLLENDHA